MGVVVITYDDADQRTIHFAFFKTANGSALPGIRVLQIQFKRALLLSERNRCIEHSIDHDV